MKSKKPTQGSEKMDRHLDDLVRNREFLSILRRLRKELDKDCPEGGYEALDETRRKRHDKICQELGELAEAIEDLRKRSYDLFEEDPAFRLRAELADRYRLDGELMEVAMTKAFPDSRNADIVSWLYPVDVCRVDNLSVRFLEIFNSFDDWIPGSPWVQYRLRAFPVALQIHSHATKRDVLDFVSKKWAEISQSLIEGRDKELRARRRKHSQKLVDFIWSKRRFKSPKIKALLDEEFPGNGLIYNDILKILFEEKKRRNSEIA